MSSPRDDLLPTPNRPPSAPVLATHVPLGFVEHIWNAEDVVHIPGTRWLIASGMVGPGRPQGHLYLIDADDKTGEELFPGQVALRAVGGDYDDTPPDIDTFDAHGLALRPGHDTRHLVYLVNHGGREAIEVFEVTTGADRPDVCWIGAILQAPGVWGNAVAPLPDGGLVATNYLDLGDPHAFEKVYAGEITGNLKEWHPGVGWEDVPGSECSAPNGVNVSADGRWYFMNSWATKTFIRISRGARPVQRDTVPVGCLADNVKWSEDGMLLVAGQVSDPSTVFKGVTDHAIVHFPFMVLKIHPETLDVRELVHGTNEHFGTAASGLEVNGELWISNARGDRLAYVLTEGARPPRTRSDRDRTAGPVHRTIPGAATP